MFSFRSPVVSTKTYLLAFASFGCLTWNICIGVILVIGAGPDRWGSAQQRHACIGSRTGCVCRDGDGTGVEWVQVGAGWDGCGSAQEEGTAAVWMQGSTGAEGPRERQQQSRPRAHMAGDMAEERGVHIVTGASQRRDGHCVHAVDTEGGTGMAWGACRCRWKQGGAWSRGQQARRQEGVAAAKWSWMCKKGRDGVCKSCTGQCRQHCGKCGEAAPTWNRAVRGEVVEQAEQEDTGSRCAGGFGIGLGS
ncbi:hypothetical protein B0H14DRAFT_2635659 [Mycena olivaceomarginata]|nr:hypothetical protein B0H14DRAFT_2635659 [Mycena olivaceomarginata]